MQKVNTFIVGAMKAGTTSFVEILSKHKDIYVPPVKEPHYFVAEMPKTLYDPSRFFDLKSYLENDFPKPLHITKIESGEQYSKIYSLAKKEKCLCDCSTAYLHAPYVPQLIKNYNKDAKIIILTRNPLKRAFSHYRMNLGLGREKDSFEIAIKKDIEDYRKNKLAWDSYLGMSLYKNAIESYKERFENILIIDFLEYQTDIERTLSKVSDFLEIEPFRSFENVRKNSTKTLKFQRLFYFLKSIGLKDYFSRFFGSRLKQKIFSFVTKDKNQEMIITSETKLALDTIFKKEMY